jgi:hypothetical protein
MAASFHAGLKAQQHSAVDSHLILDLMICTAYKSVSLLIYVTIAPSEKVFGTIGCNANHINDKTQLPAWSAAALH